MPQIYVIPTLHAYSVLQEKLGALAERLVSIVETTWLLEDLDDVTFTAILPAVFTLGERDVQIEIRYTAGKDEYNRGEPFNPSLEEQEKLEEQVERVFQRFLENNRLAHLSLSVWCKPYHNSVFQDFD